MRKMLYEKEYVHIGQIRRAHGYKGHAKVAIEDRYMADLREQRFVFIGVDGYHVPFEIEELTDRRDILLKVKTIDSSEALQRYHLSDLYLLREDLEHADVELDQEDLYRSMEGMTITDETSGRRVEIIRVDEYPSQLMAVVLIEDAERLIPLHSDLITEIDQDNKVITMNLPEGLLD